MDANDLRRAIAAHQGTFLCSRLGEKGETKVVNFAHEVTEPSEVADLPDVGRIKEFFAVFGSVLFYLDAKSGDAARYLAPPSAWPELHDDFSDWLSDLDQSERDDFVPEWVESCLVIGEEPHTGNYILMPTTGEEAGAVFHFEHDGLEFDRHADNLVQYTERLLALKDSDLAYIATHMRFVEEGENAQWWIEELRDNRGNTAKTNV